MPSRTDRRPGIYQIGQVRDDGETVVITGWGLAICARQCSCHRAADGRIVLMSSLDGRLGLVKFRRCSCCEPWEPDELLDILRDLAGFEALT